MKTRRAIGGRNRRPGSAADNPLPPATQPDLSPLDFALALMRDETQPLALRASMAKAAMPYVHGRAGDASAAEDNPAETPPKPPKSPPMSDLELARRIAHILNRTQTEAGNPVEKPANAGDGGPVGAKTV